MKQRTWWMIGLAGLVAGAILFIAFSAAQPETKEPVTLEDIYALLVTEDGQNRLDLIEQQLASISQDLDAVIACAETMKCSVEDTAEQIEQQEWTLDDMKFLLDAIQDKIDAIKTKVGA